MCVPRSMFKSDQEYIQMLRDDFAAKALQALIIALPDAHKHKDGKTLRAELAIGAYMQADAMLKEREKQQ